MPQRIDLIDPPSAFSPTSQWREFLASLGNTPQEQRERQLGEEELARRARAKKRWWVQDPEPNSGSPRDNPSPPSEPNSPQKDETTSTP
jgi:hypothetical protein